jgi:hypothetical protein
VLNYSTKLLYRSRDGPVIWFLGSFDSLNGQKLIVPRFEIFNLGDGRRVQSPYLSGYHRSVCVCVTLSAVNATCLTNVSKLPHVSRSSIVFLLQFCRTFVALLSHSCRTLVALLSHSCRTFVALITNSRIARPIPCPIPLRCQLVLQHAYSREQSLTYPR